MSNEELSMDAAGRFTKEFEEEAVRLVQRSGRTQREIAGDLGIGLSTLVRWIARRSRDRHAADPRTTAAEGDVTAELKRLRRENEILRQERDILKKATAFFARAGSRWVRAHRSGRAGFPDPSSVRRTRCQPKRLLCLGRSGRLAAANATTWSCWRMSGRPLLCRTAPMAALGRPGNCGTAASRSVAAGQPA